LARPALQAQATASGFVIDPNRPYVYLKFDHIGNGIQREESEPTSRKENWSYRDFLAFLLAEEVGKGFA